MLSEEQWLLSDSYILYRTTSGKVLMFVLLLFLHVMGKGNISTVLLPLCSPARLEIGTKLGMCSCFPRISAYPSPRRYFFPRERARRDGGARYDSIHDRGYGWERKQHLECWRSHPFLDAGWQGSVGGCDKVWHGIDCRAKDRLPGVDPSCSVGCSLVGTRVLWLKSLVTCSSRVQNRYRSWVLVIDNYMYRSLVNTNN